MSVTSAGSPLRVALINDHELVVRGLHALLANREDEIVVVELDSQLPVTQPVDLALYDTFSMGGSESNEVAELLNNPLVGAVAIYTWDVRPDVIEEARHRGVRAVLSKALNGPALIDAIVKTRDQPFAVVPESLAPDAVETFEITTGDWPGRQYGLTQREAEVIVLITAGLSNQAIADRIHLSINSVKTYIRTAYRTMNVTTRSQAVRWGLDHGLVPKATRIVPRSTVAH